jgi:nucleoside-diphosphate-sugar epimerase
VLGISVITGASGFIGQHLVENLVADGLPVRALVRGSPRPSRTPGVDIVTGDIRDPTAMRTAVAGSATVFHLAGHANDLKGPLDRNGEDDVTLGGTRNVVDASVAGGVKTFVFVSSVAVYGMTKGRAVDEEAPCVPGTAYGRAKLMAERYVLRAQEAGDMRVVCVRPAAIYGPGCKGHLPAMIRAIDRRIFPPLVPSGHRRSMVHVSDVVGALRLAAARAEARGQVYNVTDGHAYSTRELYEAICRALGRRIPVWSMPLAPVRVAARLGDVAERFLGRRVMFDSQRFEKLTGPALFSSTKIWTHLGYRSTIGFEAALPAIIEWYRRNRE